MIFVIASSGHRSIHRAAYRLTQATFATASCGEVRGRVATYSEILSGELCERCQKAARPKAAKKAEATR